MDSNISNIAKNIKALVLDCDGVFFSGHTFVLPVDLAKKLDIPSGEILKERSFADSQGIALLRSAGVIIAFVTAEKTGFIEGVVEKWNKLPSVVEGRWKPLGVFSGMMGHQKVEVIERWLSENGVSLGECAYMGDDLSDYEIMRKVGLPAAPAQAEDIIKERVHFVAKRRGGDGAIRDLVNFILKAKEVDVTTLNRR